MLRKLWIELRSSLWFVPGLLVLVAVGLALGLVQLDLVYADALRAKAWKPLFNASAEGARGMLTAIASSMITVAAMAFSITIVTLSLASTQYTPRILRNFMRDRANQFVLGIFVAIFTYCLIVLRTIRSGSERDGTAFVPLLSVALGMLLALLSIGCLIFFIHHVAASIQASYILQVITGETLTAIEVLFPEKADADGESAQAAQARRECEWHPVASHANGYIQHLDSAALLRFACEHDTVLLIEREPGDFALEGAPLVCASCPLDDAAAAALRAHFAIGDFRTVDQDAGFGIRQIVDIALKALSPGVNDTSTAVSCLDYLSAILCRLATRRLEPAFCENDGELRVITPAPDFGALVARCLDEIRLSAAGNVTILLKMLGVLQRVAGATRSTTRREALLRHARLVAEAADHSAPAAYDRERISVRIESLRVALDAEVEGLPPLSPSRGVEPWT
ncbi:MAG: DUF2254 domain-containing protein [Chthoniobacteraceae bacterium]